MKHDFAYSKNHSRIKANELDLISLGVNRLFV